MIELSVIIPTYHTDISILNTCINSVVSQINGKIEIIIVDDGNTDDYRKTVYVNDVFNTDNLKIVYKKNGGVSSARNCGVEAAKGEYITFVDSDDIVLGDFFNKGLAIAKEVNADMVVGGIVHINDNDLVIGNEDSATDLDTTIFRKDKFDEVGCLFLGATLKFKNNSSYVGRGPVAKIIKSSIAKSTPFDYSLSIYEDTVWNFDILEKCQTICLVDSAWYGYRSVEQSASKGFHKDEIIRSTLGMSILYNKVKGLSQKVQNKFMEQCIQEYCRIINTYFLSNKNTELFLKKMKESKAMLSEYPWMLIKDKSRTRMLNNKMKIKALMIRNNIWIIVQFAKKHFKKKCRGEE